MQKFRTCNLCEAMCGLVMEVEDGRITDIRADKDDVFSHGHICPKGPAMREVYEDPDRVRRPLRRVGERWIEISWADAFAEAAAPRSACTSATRRCTTTAPPWCCPGSRARSAPATASTPTRRTPTRSCSP